MEKPEFDGSETIGGFPLLKIKHALSFVGILDERDDVATIADSLACPRPQAERVLVALERRGFVTPTGLKSKWDKTALGKELTYQWKPPPKLVPAVDREDDDDVQATNEMFDDVPCSLLRTDADNGDAFEDADLEVGLWLQYTSPRVIEITVAIPDDYDNRDSSRTLESSVYLGVAEAKRFAAALQTAIERGEAEIARRAIADAKPRKKPSAPEREPAASSPPLPRPRAVAAERAPNPGAAAQVAAVAAKAERAAEKRHRLEQRALEATMKELAGKTRRRKAPTR